MKPTQKTLRWVETRNSKITNRRRKSLKSTSHQITLTLRQTSYYDRTREFIEMFHNTAGDPDGIRYKFIKHLTQESLEYLFNKILINEEFLKTWKQTIILIPNPGKDHADPQNYIPISLTGCLCKMMEQMINRRLTWLLEKNNKIPI